MMSNPFDIDGAKYFVLVNHENQYCIWPIARGIPSGWSAVGVRGEKDECLKWISSHWTDMRPQSLVDLMNGDIA
jgi:uncharacterized protein YbdZ (MbtH family)